MTVIHSQYRPFGSFEGIFAQKLYKLYSFVQFLLQNAVFLAVLLYKLAAFV